MGLLPVVLTSGVALAWHRGVTFGTLGDPSYGRLLGIKLVLVLLSVALAAVHGVLGLASSVGTVLFATALVP